MLKPDFRGMLSVLCEEGAEFLLVGIEIEGLSIGVIGRLPLIRNKRAVGRPQDLADVAWLERDQT